MKNRKKKIAAVVVALCVIAGFAICIHKPNKTVESEFTPEVTTTAEITVAEIKITPPKTAPTETTAEKEPSVPTDESETDNAPDAEQGEEIVQNFTEATKPEPPKPPEIPSEQATNPAEPPTYTPQQTTVTEATTKPKNDIPKNIGEQNGKVYVPGFGWVKATDSHSEFADDMRENGNKIGTFG